MTTIAIANNKGGVGKTTLVRNIAASINAPVLVVDLDPQANLTASYDVSDTPTIYDAITPLLDGIGDIQTPATVGVADNVWLVPGDLRLSLIEGDLANAWTLALSSNAWALRVVSAFGRAIRAVAKPIVLIDVGPSLGAITQAALIAADYVIVPVTGDKYSLMGAANLEKMLDSWRKGWAERVKCNPSKQLILPQGQMEILGQVTTGVGTPETQALFIAVKTVMEILGRA